MSIRSEPGEIAPPPGVPADSARLRDHIVATYHDPDRCDLPDLVRLARRVEAVHRGHRLAPNGLGDALEAFLKTLLDHMAKEERILFPAIREGFAGSLFGPIVVMRHEQDHAGEDMRAIEVLAHGFAEPEDACQSWRGLYEGLAAFASRFAEHVRLENEVLFPRFERARGPTQPGLTNETSP